MDKKRVLFVDDEPMVLRMLERLMRTVRDEWESVFVDSGRAALAEIDRTPFDAVVSDMRMPSMDGAELLTAVMERQPRTIRFILSGHADRNLIGRCIGATHQFLAKPCELETLRSSLRRALTLQNLLQQPALQTAVARIRALPVLPTLYSEMVDRLRNPRCTTLEIASLVARDPSLAAQSLKLVNSAFFGIGREISDLHEAVNYLGIETMKSLALSFRIFEQFHGGPIPAALLERLWQHSFATAAASRTIASLRDATRKLQDESFTAGLLHDLGKLILAAEDPAAYAGLEAESHRGGTPLCQLETARFGAHHAEVGAYLLGLWGLPTPIVEAVALHHEPLRTAAPEFAALTAVHVANASSHPDALPTSSPGNQVDLVYLTAIGCDGELEGWMSAVKDLGLGVTPR